MFSKALSRWLYPSWCAQCKRSLHLTEDHLCRPCLLKLTQIRLPICTRCGIEIPPHGKSTATCSRCRNRSYQFDEVFPLFRYDDNFKNLLHQVKYERKYWLLDIFSKRLKRTLPNQSRDLPSCIIPVPLDRNRLRKRTFNQSLLIAQMISKILKIPVKENVMIRKEYRSPQSWLSRKERLSNLEGLFKIKKRHEIKDQWVLLVDDVVTTGSTVHECAKIIKEEGASKVTVFTLARTPLAP